MLLTQLRPNLLEGWMHMSCIIISENQTPTSLCCEVTFLSDRSRSKQDKLHSKNDGVSQNKVQILILKGLCPTAPHLSLNKEQNYKFSLLWLRMMAAVRHPHLTTAVLYSSGWAAAQPEEIKCLFREYHLGSPLGGIMYQRSYSAKLSVYFRWPGEFWNKHSSPQWPQEAWSG